MKIHMSQLFTASVNLPFSRVRVFPEHHPRALHVDLHVVRQLIRHSVRRFVSPHQSRLICQHTQNRRLELQAVNRATPAALPHDLHDEWQRAGEARSRHLVSELDLFSIIVRIIVGRH